MDKLEGGLGAILDEMKKASEELIEVLKDVSQTDFIKIVDSNTSDEDCRSIQTISPACNSFGIWLCKIYINCVKLHCQFSRCK